METDMAASCHRLSKHAEGFSFLEARALAGWNATAKRYAKRRLAWHNLHVLIVPAAYKLRAATESANPGWTKARRLKAEEVGFEPTVEMGHCVKRLFRGKCKRGKLQKHPRHGRLFLAMFLEYGERLETP